MKTGFYPKLAFDGIRKNRRMYVPFICTCIGMVMMFYIISYLHYSDTIASMNGGQIMRSTLNLGSIVVGIFSCIFLFYTNSFLIRRRKKEFGLYHILGMGKLNIARILFWETLLTAVISLVLGIGFGILFSKLAELAMARLTHAQIIYSMHISPDSILFTLTVFGCIFILLFFNTLRQVHFSNAITLVQSESVGEKPPKGNILLGLLGMICLAAAYYLAVTVADPVSALGMFFIAVILVIVGTYLIMIAGSVLLCRLLQKNKRYYYKANHFVSISSMAYRMKRNGAGLASICILATMVLVMLSTTVSLYFGMDDVLSNRYPYQFNTTASYNSFDTMSDENTASNRDDQILLANDLSSTISDFFTQSYKQNTGIMRCQFESRAANYEEFLADFGSLFYLAIVLSIVFLIAAVLIIYYKQISEGYEDQARFDIMQKVGMTKREIKKSINSQLLTVFFLPLVGAGIHLIFAFPMIRKILLLFNLTNLHLYTIVTLISFGAFALFYTIVYRITSNAYYHIVSGASNSR